MEHYPLDKYEENDRRKILKECAHTRNKHIEIEARYEKLVSRRSPAINPEELEAALRGSGGAEISVHNQSRKNTKAIEEKEALRGSSCIPEDGEKIRPHEASTADVSADRGEAETDTAGAPGTGYGAETHDALEAVSDEKDAEAGTEEETGEEHGKEQVTFEEILNIQKSILKRISKSSEELEAFLFGADAKNCGDYPVYAEPKIKKLCQEEESDPPDGGVVEAEPAQEPEKEKNNEAAETEEIILVEADDIIMPEAGGGLGTVYASPLVNEKYRGKEEKHSAGKSILGIALAALVLVIGALAVYYIWPSGI